MAVGDGRGSDARDLLRNYSPGTYYQGGEFPLLRHVLDLRPDGVALEFGVGAGMSLQMIAERMPVVGFDSFQGLPEDWRKGYPKGAMAFQPPRLAAEARLVAGWFSETLPGFDFAALGPIGLVHVDCDLYSSTKTVLAHAGPYLRSGCFVVFDEWFAHGYSPGIARRNEQRAWREFVSGKEIGWDVVGRSDQEWAIRVI